MSKTTDSLRRMIVEGSLQLGEALSEAKVAQWLNVSRTPVREAFARLEIEGLVTSEPQRNTRVFKLGTRDLNDICDVRDALEPKALALAMERSQKDLEIELKMITEMMSRSIRIEDISEYLRLDTQFHQAILYYSENEFLYDSYQIISSKLAAMRTRLVLHVDYLMKGYGEHILLSEFVAAGDVESALDVLDKHISRQEDSFWRLSDQLTGLSEHQFRRREESGGNPELHSRNAQQQIARQGQDSSAHSWPAVGDEIEDSDDNYIDETSASKQVDEKRRGRPRIYADDATRKRVWAARQRKQKKAQRLIAGGTPPKRGRPRKAEIKSDSE